MKTTTCVTLLLVLALVATAVPAFAQETGSKPAEAKAPASAEPGADDMAKMMALGQPGENHKILAQLVGNWSYKVKLWMVPGAPPSESSGSAVATPKMGGRYIVTNADGKFEMPGSDGQMHSVDFKGMGVDAYDNVKQKFFSSWIDNMGTGILISEGTYDPASKTLTYHAEEEDVPGVKRNTREVIKFLDHDHYVMDDYEEHGSAEAKIMEISYTRQADASATSH